MVALSGGARSATRKARPPLPSQPSSLLTLFPLVLLVSSALKTRQNVKVDPFGLFTSFSLENIDAAWNEGNFGEYLVNSFLLSVPSTMLVVVLSTLGGYAFARLPFRGRTVAFYSVVFGLLVPLIRERRRRSPAAAGEGAEVS